MKPSKKNGNKTKTKEICQEKKRMHIMQGTEFSKKAILESLEKALAQLPSG